MRMEDRRPRKSRFGSESHEARLAYLRERAPTLAGGKRLRTFAILGSVLMILTVTAFYLAMQIYHAAAEEREDAFSMEVDLAPDTIPESQTARTLARAQAEAEAEAVRQQTQLEELQSIELLQDPVIAPPSKPEPPAPPRSF